MRLDFIGKPAALADEDDRSASKGNSNDQISGIRREEVFEGLSHVEAERRALLDYLNEDLQVLSEQ